jgi:hypothetical protein
VLVGRGAQAIVSCGSFLLEWIPSARSRTWADPRARVCRVHRHHHHSPSSVTLHAAKHIFTLSAARHCPARDCIVSGRRPVLATHCLFCSLLCSRPTLAPSKLPHRADAPRSSRRLAVEHRLLSLHHTYAHHDLRSAAPLHRTCPGFHRAPPSLPVRREPRSSKHTAVRSPRTRRSQPATAPSPQQCAATGLAVRCAGTAMLPCLTLSPWYAPSTAIPIPPDLYALHRSLRVLFTDSPSTCSTACAPSLSSRLPLTPSWLLLVCISSRHCTRHTTPFLPRARRGKPCTGWSVAR